jgi:hypothetical protein
MTRLSIITLAFFFASCHSGKNKPNVSHIKVDVNIERFEQSFFKIDSNHIREGLIDLRNAYPDFYPVFLRDILLVNPMDTSSFAVIRGILTSYHSINDSIQKKYSNLAWLKDELTEGFRYVKYYYPQYNVPRVITFIGTLDAPGVILSPQYLGIGLHQFAGKDFSVYQAAPVQEMYPGYISRRFDREYITPNVFKAVADDIYPDKSVGNPLIEQMVEKGKQWWLLDHFLPDVDDTLKTGFTGKQLAWTKENEGNIWSYIMKNENLYSIEPTTIQNYLGEAPSTQGLPDAAPGNIGQWIGWRIVENYASRHSDLKLQQVLSTPARTIFQESGYKPK